MPKSCSHITILSLLALAALLVGAWLNTRNHFSVWALETGFDVSNQPPVFNTPPSDGGSSTSNPTNSGSTVTFTAKALDINSDQYYLAVCKTDTVTVGDNAAPTCAPSQTLGISSATNSDTQATATYTALSTDPESNTWYAFVCDKLPAASSPACHPANSNGNGGRAIGTLTFSAVPEDGDYLTVDSIIYEFDTANNGITGGRTEVDTSGSSSAGDAAYAFELSEAGANSYMVARGTVVYVYATSVGVAGNSIAMSEPTANEGGSSDQIALSGATLAGGSDDNATPFYVNHAPTFGTVTATAPSGLGSNDGDAYIEPGEWLRLTLPNAQIDDADVSGAQDTINMYICTNATTSFNYSTNSCTGGTLVCSATGVNPTTTDAVCNESSNILVPIPTLDTAQWYKVYVEDAHSLPATGNNAQSYAVADVPPTLVPGSEYSATPSPVTLTAADRVQVTYSARFQDDNGESDILGGAGVLYDADATTNACATDERSCFRSSSCTTSTAWGTSSQAEVQCVANFWFNANYSSNWEMHIDLDYETGRITSYTDSNINLQVPALSAISALQSEIAYGSLALGASSSGQIVTLQNVGNQIFDVLVSGTDMAYSTYSIPRAQQKFHETSSVFDWDSGGGYPLVATPISGCTSGPGGTCDEVYGCLNRDIAVRTYHASNTLDESIYFKIKIPTSQMTGTYTGTVTLSTNTYSGPNSCSGTAY